MSPEDRVLAYHERTKHRPGHYARSLGYLDWNNQPNPFRIFRDAPLIPLERSAPGTGPRLDEIYEPRQVAPRSLDRASLSQLWFDSLALSAWKRLGRSMWSLRCNPSSGNLHPTEGYVLAPAMEGMSQAPALYHYAPLLHSLECRAWLSADHWRALVQDLPAGAFLVGLTSIHWRESWKYGERAYRYCQHDVGHAMAAIAYAAAALGWQAHLLEAATDAELALLLGIHDQSGIEAEHADCLLLVCPADRDVPRELLQRWRPAEPVLAALAAGPLLGVPEALSQEHHEWPVIDEVAGACARLQPPSPAYWAPALDTPEHAPPARPVLARQIMRQRRSAVDLDGQTRMQAQDLYRILHRLVPRRGCVPFAALPWQPLIHPVLFVHRVDGLVPGLYALVRDPGQREALAAATSAISSWTRPPGCPEGLDFFLLEQTDSRSTARLVSCEQDIAADGAFAVAMLAAFEPALRAHGAWLYRRMHWEAGAVGQVLYLEAEAAGVRGTGIGCFFDDLVHELLGLGNRAFQTLYHFTVGGPVEDPRLQTVDAYFHLDENAGR